MQDIVQAIETYNCHVVAVVTPRFGESIPGLPEWLADNYLGLYAQSETFVYFAKKGTDNNYIPIANGDFGRVVRLYGLRLSEQPWSKGMRGFISLFWELQGPYEDEYNELITLRNVTNRDQIYQVSRVPFEEQFNPAAWQVNERVKDTFWLDLPTDLPGGTYDLYLSLCTSEAGQCLPVENITERTELYLGQIIIEP